MKKFILASVQVMFALCLVFGSGQSQSQASQPYVIEVSGSTSVYPLMEVFSETYSALHPVRINVNGTGSSDGISAANTGSSELGMSSRNLRSSELGYGLDEMRLAIDAIAVIIHPSNPIGNLSLEQVRDIYTGKVRDWSEIGGVPGPIAVVSREPGSGTRGAFEEILGFEDQLIAGALEFDGTGAVRASIAGNPQAIGYISLGSMDASVKPLGIAGVEPSVENVLNGSYGIARPFLILYRGDQIAQETRAFLDWMLGKEAQTIVGDKGYVPVQ